MSKYDYVVVGAGISGATVAQYFAERGKKILVFDKRSHLSGNCYDYYNEAGILVPAYGPHFFHTNSEKVWQYVSQFTDWIPYEHRVLSCVEGELVPIPVNIEAVNILFGLEIKTEKEMEEWLEKNREKIDNPVNSEEVALTRVGRMLYEKMFKNYTKKHWGVWPKELLPSVMSRIPVRTNFDDRYFTDQYQFMPQTGYAELFKKMLNHPNITVEINTDYFSVRDKIKNFKKLFFTGRIDQFFDYKFGKLPYRSLRFEYETLEQEYYQKRAQINYPNDHVFTRITEPKHATGQKHSLTTIIREYSESEGEPYYPFLTDKNIARYEKYRQAAKEAETQGIYFIGRLAEYKYLNMDQAFENCLKRCQRIEDKR